MHRIPGTAFFAVAALIGTLTQAQTIQVNKDNRVIALTATGNAKADADIARVHIGFQVFARDADSAYAKGSQTSNAIAAALKKAGVEDKSIESETEDVGRNDEFVPFWSSWDETKKQFTVQQSWTVTTAPRDAARVLHVAVQAGANNNGNIDWDLADRDALGAKAAAKALEKAQSAATEMAAALHVTLKGLIYASNQTGSR